MNKQETVTFLRRIERTASLSEVEGGVAEVEERRFLTAEIEEGGGQRKRGEQRVNLEQEAK